MRIDDDHLVEPRVLIGVPYAAGVWLALNLDLESHRALVFLWGLGDKFIEKFL